jgi:periplasmic copper chaperone A
MRCRLSRRLVLAAPALLLVRPVHAQTDIRAGDLVLSRPWTRATPAGARVAGGYLSIRNAGTQPDRLTGGSFAEAGRVEVHEMTMANGVMIMREVTGGLEIPAAGSVELKPGGLHVMFMDLKRTLVKDEMIAGTLVFARAGTVAVRWHVAALGAPAAGHSH